MKVIKGFKLANSVLATALALALAGCGDDPFDPNAVVVTPVSGGNDSPVTTNLAGKVADGYLREATVCLDLNKDKICGTNEPMATSGSGGVFSIADVTQSEIDANPLLVEIEAGTTIDEDFPDAPLTKSYKLSAPAGSTFVSPLTTMVQNIIEQDNSTATAAEKKVTAETAVKALLNTALDLNADYIAGKSGSENQAEFEKLHIVAQVIALVIATKMEESKDQVAAGDFTIEELSSEIMGKVFAVLDDITAQVEAGDDLDTIATDINGKVVITVQPESEEFVLISSTGAASEINDATVIGEWSTGSQIDAEGNYEGLNAWTITSAVEGDVNENNWGTVLALTGGFVGDFSEFDILKLKIATSGGYADGYFIKISTNGVESGDIPLSVDDGVTGWQDVEVDLADYDLSSIEYIALFAIGGTANVSKIHIADLSLADTGTGEVEAALKVQKEAAAALVDSSYSTSTWAALTTALAMPETTQAEVTAKTAAITTAISGLEPKDPVAVDVTALSAAMTAANAGNLALTDIGSLEGQVSQADWQTFSDAISAAGVIRDAAADQATVDQAIIVLAAAQVVFNSSKIVVIVDPGLEEGPNLVVNGDFDDLTLANDAGSVGEWNYYTNTDTVVAIADSEMTAIVTSVGGGQWDNQIWNQVRVTEEGDYVVKLTASSTVERDILIRVDAIGMNGMGTTSTDSDVIAHLTTTPQVFTLYVSGSAFTADAAFKIVTSLGVLEAANTTSVASTVTFDDVYLGTLAEAVVADKTELATAVATAQVLHNGGADETLKAAYQTAIDTAQAVLDNADLTQTEADAAVAALAVATVTFDPTVTLPVVDNLVINGDFTDSTVGTGTDVGQWNYYTSTGTVLAIADNKMTAVVTEVGGQWDNQITNEVQVTEEGTYVVKVTASSTVDRDILIRVDGIEMGNDGTLSSASDVIAHLTSTPQTFTRYFNGIGFTNNARFKVVMSVGGLEAAGTTSVASTVTFDDVYLGTFTGEIPTDIATLSSAITVATNVFNAAVEGTETGQYTTSKADLQTAIDAAKVVVDTVDVTQEQIDAGVAALAAARTTFEAGLVVEAIAGAQISTPAGDLNYTPAQWDTGTTQDLVYTGDATYSPSIQLVGTGGWGTALAMTEIPAGTLAQYTSIEFKVKTTDFTEIKVKVPEEERGFALSTGTDLGDGWVQMSIPMSEFGDAAPAAAVQFAIFGAGGTGTILLSDISFL
ncbi:hypothetical protein [Psychromonas sp.]|uniref:hypothetical protein n=1 Tax=Psychromonas sp. TaxID=1884585 RepID=UPI0039E6C001